MWFAGGHRACQFTQDGFPVGIQFMARALNDHLPIAAAGLFQSRTDWHTRHPHISD